ncbi:MAG: hypothetical protein WCI51_01785 [Lentisphaerota bacterium]
MNNNIDNIDNTVDLADAWLDWKKTCAIDLCAEDYKDALKKIAYNRFKIYYNAYQQNLSGSYSEWQDILKWKKGDENKLNPFHLIEQYLYNKDKIKGQPFKDYLFQHIAVRQEGAARNLTGYLLCGMMRTLVRESFNGNKNVPLDEVNDDNGGDLHSKLEDVNAESPDTKAHENDIRDRFIDFFEKLNETDKIALFCCFEKIPMRAPEVLSMISLGGSTFSERPKKLLEPLVAKFKKEKIGSSSAMSAEWHAVVYGWASQNTKCRHLLEIFGMPENADMRRRKN